MDPGRPACCAALSGLPRLGFVRLSWTRFSAPEVENSARNAKAAQNDGRTEDEKRLAPVHVVLATSVDLNPFGPISLLLDSPPDLLDDSASSGWGFRSGGLRWLRFLCGAARLADPRRQRWDRPGRPSLAPFSDRECGYRAS